MLNRAWLRQRKLWCFAGAAVLLVAVLIGWAVRSYQRAQARDSLNAYAPFESPPLEILFPSSVVEKEDSRAVLEAGAREGIWTLQRRNGDPPYWEVRLTDEGQRWFSTVGNRIVATFRAGSRQVTRVLALEGTFPSRRVRFRYVWTELHLGTVVLGEMTPTIAKEYDGEALFLYERDRWRILDWSTPEFDQAVARFKSLEAARR